MSKTDMEEACDKIIAIFHEYSKRSKDDNTDLLDITEFKKMVDEQFIHCLVNFRQPQSIDQLFQEMDKNKDGCLNFPEFMDVLGQFLICCHDKFHKGDTPHHD